MHNNGFVEGHISWILRRVSMDYPYKSCRMELPDVSYDSCRGDSAKSTPQRLFGVHCAGCSGAGVGVGMLRWFLLSGFQSF